MEWLEAGLAFAVTGLLSDVQKEKDKPNGKADKQPEDARVDPVKIFLNTAAAKAFELPPEGRAPLNADRSLDERR